MQSGRTDRLAHQFQQEIATILQQELKNPHLGFVTITRVELTRDLSRAKVFFGCLGGEEDLRRSQRALDRAAYFIHGLIKKRFRLKTIPQIVFQYDESIVESIELTNVFDRIKQPPGSTEDSASSTA